MIGGYIGKAIGEPVRRTALQIITANVTAGVSIVKAVASTMTASVSATATVIKAVSFTVSAAMVNATATVIKSIGKTITAAAVGLFTVIKRAFTRETISASVISGVAPGASVRGGELADATITSSKTITGVSGGGTRIKAN